MLVSNSAIESLVSRFVAGRGVLDEVSRESFSNLVPTTVSPVSATLSSSSNSNQSTSQSSTQDESAFNESFARMMIGLKSQVETSLSSWVADTDNGVSVSSATSAQNSSVTSVQQEFLDYMKQPANDRLREQLTGVSKDQYQTMTPEEQKTVDLKFQEALKQQQQTVKEDINTRIKALKAGLIA